VTHTVGVYWKGGDRPSVVVFCVVRNQEIGFNSHSYSNLYLENISRGRERVKKSREGRIFREKERKRERKSDFLREHIFAVRADDDHHMFSKLLVYECVCK